MAVWSAGAQRPCKGVRQQEGGGKGAAPQRGRGEGSQAVFRQGTRAGRSRAQRGPGEHEARSAGPCTARGKTRSPRGAGERVSPLPPEGPARPLVGVGEAHGLRGGGTLGYGLPPVTARRTCAVSSTPCGAATPSPPRLKPPARSGQRLERTSPPRAARARPRGGSPCRRQAARTAHTRAGPQWRARSSRTGFPQPGGPPPEATRSPDQRHRGSRPQTGAGRNAPSSA